MESSSSSEAPVNFSSVGPTPRPRPPRLRNHCNLDKMQNSNDLLGPVEHYKLHHHQNPACLPHKMFETPLSVLLLLNISEVTKWVTGYLLAAS